MKMNNSHVPWLVPYLHLSLNHFSTNLNQLLMIHSLSVGLSRPFSFMEKCKYFPVFLFFIDKWIKNDCSKLSRSQSSMLLFFVLNLEVCYSPSLEQHLWPIEWPIRLHSMHSWLLLWSLNNRFWEMTFSLERSLTFQYNLCIVFFWQNSCSWCSNSNSSSSSVREIFLFFVINFPIPSSVLLCFRLRKFTYLCFLAKSLTLLAFTLY